MLSVLAIGDPHFKHDNGVDTALMTDKIEEIIDTKRPDVVVILGDILHTFEKFTTNPFHRVYKFLDTIHEALLDYGGFLCIIIGNHDRTNNTVFMTDEHVFNPYKKWENVIVADCTTIVTEIAPSSGAEFNIMLVPYVQPGRLIEAIGENGNERYVLPKEKVKLFSSIPVDQMNYTPEFKKSIDIVFTHQEFFGASMNSITSNHGDVWPIDNPLCVSGHIHDYQKLANNLIYTGTPIQHGYADHSRKTVSLFEYNIETRGYKEERISLGIKGKKRFTINAEEFIEKYRDYMAATEEHHVTLVVSGSKSSLKTLTKSPEYRKASGVMKIKPLFQDSETMKLSSGGNHVIPETKPQVPFRQRLEEELARNMNVMKMFRQIFDQ